MTSRTKQSCGRRAIAVSGEILAIAVLLTFGLASGLLLHLDLPAMRRAVVVGLNGVLGRTVAGDVRIERISGLGIRGLDGLRARVRDPDGVRVVSIDGGRVRLDAARVARSVLLGRGPVRIDVASLSIRDLDVNVDAGVEDDALRIARAFEPRGPTESPTTTESAGRGLRITLPTIVVRRARVHGAPTGARVVDAQLFDLVARARVSASAASGRGPSVDAELDHARVVTRGLPRRIDPRGSVSGRFALPAPSGRGIFVQAKLDGLVGGIPTIAEAEIDDRRLHARIDMRDRTGEKTTAILSEVHLRDPVSLHAEARGDLPRLDVLATLRLGEARVEASAEVDLRRQLALPVVKGSLMARGLDASAIVADAPHTSLGLEARASLDFAADGLHGELTVDTLPGTVEGQRIPRIVARGRFAGASAHIRATIDDPAMPTSLVVDVSPRGEGGAAKLVTASVRSRAPDLSLIPELGGRLAGAVEVDATGRLLFPEMRIEDARVSLRASRLSDHVTSVARLEARARMMGSLDRAVIDASARGSNVVVGARSLAGLEARGRVELSEDAVTVRGAKLRAVRLPSRSVEASVRRARISGEDVRVEGVEIRGLGDRIRGDVSKDERGIRVSIDAPRIDLADALELAGVEGLVVERGSLGVRGTGVVRRGVAKGQLELAIASLDTPSVKDGTGVLQVSIDDRDVDLALVARAGDAGAVELRSEHLRIDGRVDDVRAWRRASGRVRLSGVVDLHRVLALAPNDLLPSVDLRGRLSVQGHVGRDSPKAPPELALSAHTRGLMATGGAGARVQVDGVTVEGPPRWRLADVDLGFDARTDGPSGLAAVAFRATDRTGAVVALDAKAILPFDQLEADPALARARLVDTPMSIRMTMPRRRIDRMPTLLGLQGADGFLEAELEASGTMLEPRVRIVARTRGAHTAAMPIDVLADTDVVLDYDGEKADLVMKVSALGEELLAAGAHVEARARDLVAASILGAPESSRAWTASASTRLTSFPLECAPPLAERRIRGRVSGHLELVDLHLKPRATGRLNLTELTIGDVEYGAGSLTIDADERELLASARLDQEHGFVDARVRTSLEWDEGSVPTLGADASLDASLEATALRAAIFQPFVGSALPVIDGRIDASVTARLAPGDGKTTLGGKAVLRDGSLHVAALGQELHAVRATATLAPDGSVHVTDVYARGAQGEVSADAAAKLDGLSLVYASANVRVPRGRPLALIVHGRPVGEVSGVVRLKATPGTGASGDKVVVEVPELAVALPRVSKAGVQSLDVNEDIRVGVYRGRDRFVTLPLQEADLRPEEEPDASRVEVALRLGSVTVTRGNQLRAILSGEPSITIEDGETTYDGRIDVSKGWLDVHGKKFEIEKGTITFDGRTPPNPTVVATAAWTAADGTRVHADFVGPMRSGKISLRSEPPLPKSELLALLLFGTADGANPQLAPREKLPDGTTKAAVGLGGGLVAEGLAEALDDLTGIQTTARIDTTRSSNPRPEIELQISPRVSVSFAHVIGTPPISEPDRNLASIEYRVHRNWSLETTFGDRGTALFDAIWQKRY